MLDTIPHPLARDAQILLLSLLEKKFFCPVKSGIALCLLFYPELLVKIVPFRLLSGLLPRDDPCGLLI
jgi:hypothetical protein